MSSIQFGSWIPLITALLLVLLVAACASGPLGSHGVDYIPSFDTAPPDASIGGRWVAQAATIEDKI